MVVRSTLLCRVAVVGLVLAVGSAAFGQKAADKKPAAKRDLRVATYNTSLYRDQDGQLIRDLEGGQHPKAKQVAEVVQRVRPDIILLNEFDYDADGKAAESFCKEYLAVGQNGLEPIEFAYRYTGPVNTGRPSGKDLDHDGKPGGPADNVGFGRHEGQYGMLVLSRFPIEPKQVRSFQKFLWRDMPKARLPVDPKTGNSYYSDDELDVLCLSSKSFWDVPIEVTTAEGESQVIHLLCSHPTPPVFDGPEDRNGLRNFDEIRLVADYISPDKAEYLVDDQGKKGGLAEDAAFVIVGDLNADPIDGESADGAIKQLLKHPRVDSSFTPGSEGGSNASKSSAALNSGHRGDPANDTADFGKEGVSNLRIDYVLPSKGLKVVDGGVFWPRPDEPGGEAITTSDHRSVWLDIDLPNN